MIVIIDPGVQAGLTRVVRAFIIYFLVVILASLVFLWTIAVLVATRVVVGIHRVHLIPVVERLIQTLSARFLLFWAEELTPMVPHVSPDGSILPGCLSFADSFRPAPFARLRLLRLWVDVAPHTLDTDIATWAVWVSSALRLPCEPITFVFPHCSCVFNFEFRLQAWVGGGLHLNCHGRRKQCCNHLFEHFVLAFCFN